MSKQKKSSGYNKTLFFTAKWCPPCQVVKRMLSKQEALAKKLEIVDIDTEEGEKLAVKFKVRGIPAFIHPDGTLFVGGMNKKELEAFVEAP